MPDSWVRSLKLLVFNTESSVRQHFPEKEKSCRSGRALAAPGRFGNLAGNAGLKNASRPATRWSGDQRNHRKRKPACYALVWRPARSEL